MEQTIAGIGCLTGIAPWKRRRIVQLLQNRHGPPHARTAREAVRIARRNGGAVACWASRMPADLPRLARAAGVEVWSIEDGFIRSAELGAALTQPASVVIDRRGRHYDPAQPSDLEHFLQTASFPPELLERAAVLIKAIRRHAITKYNLAGSLVKLPAGRRIVLVPGQVEGDLSVVQGGGGMTMQALIARVRAEEPDAFLIYKPHPDVAAGLRHGESAEGADLIVQDASLADLLDRVDAVHVLTSLAGFEALLRGREVVTHGQPFYAGWGLTRDLAPLPRRTRRLTLDELAAGVLIEYPVYGDPLTGRRCTPEETIAAIAAMPPGTRPAAWRLLPARVAGWLGRFPQLFRSAAHASHADP